MSLYDDLATDLSAAQLDNESLRERVAALEAALRAARGLLDAPVGAPGDWTRQVYDAAIARADDALAGGTAALDAALAKARREGAERMRERAAQETRTAGRCFADRHLLAREIRALPLDE